MDNDDVLVGRVLSRRELLGLMGAAGMALLVGCSDDGGDATATSTRAAAASTAAAGTTAAATAAATAAGQVPTCVVKPELMEGPFFLDEMLERSDIRGEPSDGSTSEGAPLALTLLVSRVGDRCEPLEGAIVDLWQCDAAGVYSGVSDGTDDTRGKQFLRGYQVTDATGRAAFTTIYPGWYQGRTTHIHFKIRTEEGGAGYEFTSQLFFDDAFTDEVYRVEPYVSQGERGTRNANDGIFGQVGDQLTLDVSGDPSGYAATFAIGLQL